LQLYVYPAGLFKPSPPFENFIHFNAERSDYGPGNTKEPDRRRVKQGRNFEPHRFERAGPDGAAIEIRCRPLPAGGFVTTNTDITRHKSAEEELRTSRDKLEAQVEKRLRELTEEITARKRAEEMLREAHDELRQTKAALRGSEKRLRLATDSLPSLIAYINSTNHYCFANKNSEDWHGIKAKDAVGKHVREVIGEKLFKDTLTCRTSALEGEEVNCEFEVVDKLGNPRQLYAILLPHAEASGEVFGYFALTCDITDRKHAETARRIAKEEADAANNAKSEFLYSMSHELRAPLNAILGFGQLLQYNPKLPLTCQQHQYVANILDGGKHLLNLINEVLDLSITEAGHASISIEDVKMADIIEESLVFTKPLAEKHGIRVMAQGLDKRTPVVRADYTHLKQAILNLLSNAVKYNRSRGMATIECAKGPPGMVRIGVSDTGPGIPANKQAELFQPFSRLGDEDTKIEGTGIGLTLTKKLIEFMGGSIGFESKVGECSTFWIEMPRAKRASLRKDNDKASEAPRRGTHLNVE